MSKDINWKKLCKHCGQCCGPVPFDAQFFADNNDKMRREPVEVIPEAFPGMVLVLTEDGYCVFLTDNKRCAIYDERPMVCRLYGTVPEMRCPKLS